MVFVNAMSDVFLTERKIFVRAELNATDAVVMGGAIQLGGRGGAIDTFLGVVILGVVSNLMSLARMPGYRRQVSWPSAFSVRCCCNTSRRHSNAKAQQCISRNFP